MQVAGAAMLEATTNERLTEMEESLNNICYARVIDEVSHRELQLERRERDKGVRIGMFSSE